MSRSWLDKTKDNAATAVDRAATAAGSGGGGSSSGSRAFRRQHLNQQDRRQNNYWRTSTGIAVAKFGLLSVATLPFTAWLALFTYDYYYRVDICRRRLMRQLPSSRSGERGWAALDGSNNGDDAAPEEGRDGHDANSATAATTTLVGRDREVAEVSALLSGAPNQIIVIAGGNEAGKSTFVAESLLLRCSHSRKSNSSSRQKSGTTLVQLAALVDSVSSFTSVLVDAFDLRWLRLRHSLIDVLPFAGSEILVMKERFGDRDLEQALDVVTRALERVAEGGGGVGGRKIHQKQVPVIVIDGLGEGAADWGRTAEGRRCAQRFLQWCVYVTKERRLAHVVLTGNEQLVLSLIDQTRITRGHAKVIGLGELNTKDAAAIVKREFPSATESEIKRITGIFGGFVHDVKGASRDIQYRLSHGSGREDGEADSKGRAKIIDEVIKARFQQQVERVTAAFAQARDEGNTSKGSVDSKSGGGDDEMDPFLDPLKAVYSEAHARHSSNALLDDDEEDGAAAAGSWTQLQLWKTLQRVVESPGMAVLFSELRDDIFDGDKDAILELMREDVLGFEVDCSSGGGWNWKVTPATPAVGKAFAYLVNDSAIKQRFGDIELRDRRLEQLQKVENQRSRLWKERNGLDLRKRSLLQTIELAKELGREDRVRRTLAQAFEEIVAEERALERRSQTLSQQLSVLLRDTHQQAHFLEDNKTDPATAAPSSLDEHSSIRALLKSALLDRGVDSSTRLKDVFRAFDECNEGKMTASDLVELIKATTGLEIDADAARALVLKWDQNDDRKINYNEFMRMLLADAEEIQKQQAKRP